MIRLFLKSVPLPDIETMSWQCYTMIIDKQEFGGQFFSFAVNIEPVLNSHKEWIYMEEEWP